LREPNAADTAHLLLINESRDFPRVLGSIDCMHQEWKNFPFHGKVNTSIIQIGARSYLRRLCHNISGSDILSLTWPIHTMVSTCCSNHRYSQDLQKAMLQRSPTRSMVTLIPKGTILQLVSILPRNHLGRLFADLKMMQRVSLLKRKSLLGRMWRGYLVCSNLVGPLFGTLSGLEDVHRCGRS
jgi:hypothetical protein